MVEKNENMMPAVIQDQKEEEFDNIYFNIKEILEDARQQAFRAVNFYMVQAYWQIGKVIVEKEQKGEERAEYGKALVERLSKKLTNEFGKGFNKTNIWYMKQFYLMFPNPHALRGELSWTHYRMLLKALLLNGIERSYYV